ncbi:MAG: molybdopterin-dependent oxidoreductase [Pseudomonadales bacterium]|nr:molybdopterin-dependent oxidoreductase [Pseudomonadales bacterium]
MAAAKYPSPIRNIYDLADAINYGLHDLLLSGQPLVREYDRANVAQIFPTSGVTSPRDERYQRMLANNFEDWTLKIEGLVDNPMELSLSELRAMNSQTQVTLHTCDEGWSAIGEWTGVPLWQLLQLVGVQPGAKYVIFHCMDTQGDGNLYYESIDLFAASHPQTILAYGLNGNPVPEPNGAPLRLRIETQIGYKHAKFVERVEVTDTLAHVGAGRGGWWEDIDNAVWYAGL